MKPWGWTKQQVQTLKDRYAEANNKRLADELGVPVKTLLSKAWAMGLKKSRTGLTECRAHPGSRQGQVRDLVKAAGLRGLRAVDVATALGTSTDAAHTTLSNMTQNGLLWIVRGRRGESRWFSSEALAMQARDAAAAPFREPLSPCPAVLVAAPAAAEPVPLNVTATTRHVVAPPMPDRYACEAPADAVFASRRPGEYALPASRWVSAVTGQA